MPYTVPNQRTVTIHRESAKADFLGIKNENWKAAARDLRPHAFLLYLYLASNANNFTLALSPAAVRQEIGMARSTYHDQFHVLLDKGYLVPSHGNTYEFFETPQPRPGTNPGNELSEVGQVDENGTSDGKTVELPEQSVLSKDIEINNSKSINNGINIQKTEPEEGIYIPKVKEVIISAPQAEGRSRPKYVPEIKREAFDF